MSAHEHQVLPAVVVIIEKLCAPTQERIGRLGDPHLRRDINKVGIAVVAVERLVVVGEGRGIEIEPAIIHVVAHGQSH